MKVAVVVTNTEYYLKKLPCPFKEKVEEFIGANGDDITFFETIPSDRQVISDILGRLVDEKMADLVLTICGSGCNPADITPEATLDVIDKQLPGIPEAIRSLNEKQRLVLNRGVAGIRNSSIIVNLPKKEMGVMEALKKLYPQLKHGVDNLQG
ncbi:MAG: MogA/MoaB family molybdenum cofactor biosynthesis protein [Lachnospiraceae bacterium]|jgi:molybdopterin biosynthesis enzyme MoaB|nr:MogA/MoaB family molybdenum cofactor biosynthesis protein [Lachnospiraceae bacterium]